MGRVPESWFSPKSLGNKKQRAINKKERRKEVVGVCAPYR